MLRGRDVRRARRVSDDDDGVHRRQRRRLRGRRGGAVLSERDVHWQAMLRRRALRLAGPELRRHPAPRHLRQFGLRRLRGGRADVLHRRPRWSGDRRELLHDVGRGVQSRDEPVHRLRRQRAALLRRRLVRGRRLLRPDRRHVRREHGDVRRRSGEMLRGRLPRGRVRRHGRGVLRRRCRMHGAVLGVPGQRVRRLRGAGRAVLPGEQHRRVLVQRRRDLRGGELRDVWRQRPALLRRRGVQGGTLQRREVPVGERVTRDGASSR
jgi:hypothetical protein